jgi:hypothetical protein
MRRCDSPPSLRELFISPSLQACLNNIDPEDSMGHSAEDLASDRSTFRNLGIVIGTLIGVSVAIAGWVFFLSHALEGRI